MGRVLRVFLSSTALDLRDYRRAVADAILRLGNLPVAMESFSAKSGQPVRLCKEYARKCDCIVVIVGHRYGWVPQPNDGGDGIKSITIHEYDAAFEAEKPVFAFVVNPDHPWSLPKEQDLLIDANTESDEQKVVKNVRQLKEFKSFLSNHSGIIRDSFTSPEDLAARVTASLANWVLARDNDKVDSRPSPKWKVHECHPLQRAPHFQGRRDVLETLQQWWDDPTHPDRLFSLVGIGGAGKTAVAERFLRTVRTGPLPGHVLIWSFYENNDPESFFREACTVFGNRSETGDTSGHPTSLQHTLSGEERHLIVLDGLEKMQSEGEKGRARGELLDNQLKILLRSIARGIGRTKCLTTSRFRLTNLDDFERHGRKTYMIRDLAEESAVGILKAWNVLGTENQLRGIVNRVGRHPLSVSVLGSYLYHYCDRRTDGLADLDLEEYSRDDPLAAKLERIIAGYAKALPSVEFDLLVRISLFNRPVPIFYLRLIARRSGDIAGALAGLDDAELERITHRLELKGLLSVNQAQRPPELTVHPFLRDHLRTYLNTNPREFHESIRSAIAPGLLSKPSQSRANTPEALQAYEQLIEESILAGKIHEAFGLYTETLGGAGQLGLALHDHRRGIRICTLFSEDGQPQSLVAELPLSSKAILLGDWGYYALALGDLEVAEHCYELSIKLHEQLGFQDNLSASFRNQAETAMHRGTFVRAQELALKSVETSRDKNGHRYGMLGMIYHVLGEIPDAKICFFQVPASSVDDTLVRLFELEHLIEIGSVEKARIRADRLLKVFEQHDQIGGAAGCHFILGLLDINGDLGRARFHLENLGRYASESGEMDLALRTRYLTAEIGLQATDLMTAIHEAQLGATEAKDNGFGWMEIKFMLTLARVHLQIPDHRLALQFAEEALKRARQPETKYAWGEADATHLSAIAYQKSGDHRSASRRFRKALSIRTSINHPGVHETVAALEQIA